MRRSSAARSRAALVQRALRYELLTVALVIPEAAASLWLGLAARSVALVAFGMDSVAETLSAVVVAWRMRVESTGASSTRVEVVEHRTALAAGGLLLLVAGYVTIDAGRRLLGYGETPHPTVAGAVLMVVSFVVMQALGRRKLAIAKALGSRAMQADAYESIICAWLAAKAFAGLLLNLLFGWWWADPVAGLVIVPLMIREGLEALRGDED